MGSEITSGCTFYKKVNGPWTEVLIKTAATADDKDTIVLNLFDYGIKNFEYIMGFAQSTASSVIITEAPTTSVTSGVLTITIGGSDDNRVRIIKLGGLA